MWRELRTLNGWGSVASLVGFLTAGIVAIFSQHSWAALLSLLVTEALLIGIFWYYFKKRLSATHPYDVEEIFDGVCYDFETPQKMVFTVTEIFKVTSPILAHKEISLTWSGRSGDLQCKCLLSGKTVQMEMDGKTGRIKFVIPFDEVKRFGDIGVVHYQIDLRDEAGVNKPILIKRVHKPLKVISWRVILRYLDDCVPAKVTSGYLTDHALTGSEFLGNVSFDKGTKSFHHEVVSPLIGHFYQIEWKAQGA